MRIVSLFLALTITVTLLVGLGKAELKATGSDSTIKAVKSLAKAFEAQSGTKLIISGGGSSNGAKAALSGKADMAFLSRHLKDKEIAAGLLEVPYAIDGVAIITSKNNPINNLHLDDLRKIYTGETLIWANGKPVLLYNRNTASGTRECFEKKVMKKQPFSKKIQIKHDAVMIRSMNKIPTAIGYTSACNVDDSVKTLKINGIAPNATTLSDKSYPICRTLVFATMGRPTGDAKAFLDFVKSPQGEAAIEEAGYVTTSK